MTTQACASALRARLIELQRDTEAPFMDDIRRPGRKIPRSYGYHVRGWHPVRDGHPAIGFESKLEARVITALVTLVGELTIASQPLTLRYRFGHNTHFYTPDFLVELEHVPPILEEIGFGERTLVEVKPLRVALKVERHIAQKFRVAREATGIDITLVTDADLCGMHPEVLHAR